jgi:hypothetical protein
MSSAAGTNGSPSSSMRLGDVGTGSMASTFNGTRNTAKTAEELKKARETRAAEALRMKDEQLKILSDQNASLLTTLDKVS